MPAATTPSPSSAPPSHVAEFPPAIHTQDPALLSRIYQTVRSCHGLVDAERQVLLGVLPNIPSQDRNSNDLLHRLLSIPSADLKLFANILEEGLVAARNFGGRPTSERQSTSNSVDGSSTGSKRSSDDGENGLDPIVPTKRPRLGEEITGTEPGLASISVSEARILQTPVIRESVNENQSDLRINRNTEPLTLPGPEVPPAAATEAKQEHTSPPHQPQPAKAMGPPSRPLTPALKLLASLGITHVLPNSGLLHEDHHFGRRQSLANNCLARQRNVCPITGRTNEPYILETAHLVPHSVAAVETFAVPPYWRLLKLCLGPTLTDHIYTIAGSYNSFRSTNGISLDSSIHTLFDRGILWLVPLVHGNVFSADTTCYYDVQFHWRGETKHLVSMGTRLPQLPEEQVNNSLQAYNFLDSIRQINDGDRFRLFTRDPVQYPLPHPLLISLHAMLWEMIAASGLAQTEKAEKGSMTPTDGYPGCVKGNLRSGRVRGIRASRVSRHRQSTASSLLSAPVNTTSPHISQGFDGHRSDLGSSGVSLSNEKIVNIAPAIRSMDPVRPLFSSEEEEYVEFKLAQFSATAESLGGVLDEYDDDDDDDDYSREERNIGTSDEHRLEFEEFHRKLAVSREAQGWDLYGEIREEQSEGGRWEEDDASCN